LFFVFFLTFCASTENNSSVITLTLVRWPDTNNVKERKKERERERDREREREREIEREIEKKRA